MQKVNFSYNWNNKLNCDCFTTIRLHYPGRFVKGSEYEITLNNQFISKATCVDCKQLGIEKLNEWVSAIDTGYTQQETIDIIKKMYPKKNIKNTLFDLVLFRKQKQKVSEQKKMF